MSQHYLGTDIMRGISPLQNSLWNEEWWHFVKPVRDFNLRNKCHKSTRQLALRPIYRLSNTVKIRVLSMMSLLLAVTLYQNMTAMAIKY